MITAYKIITGIDKIDRIILETCNFKNKILTRVKIEKMQKNIKVLFWKQSGRELDHLK